MLGLGPLQQLLDEREVTEIMVNGPDRVYVEQNGKLPTTEVSFSSEDHLRRIIERIVSRVGRRIDESSPLVDARLRRRLPDQRGDPAAGLQRLLVDDPQVRPRPVQGPATT